MVPVSVAPSTLPRARSSHDSDRESTSLASDTSLHAAEEPTRWNGLKNYRTKRYRNIPGWYDRWDVLGSFIQLPHAIVRLIDDRAQAFCRRRVVLGIASHMTLITCGIAVLMFVPFIANGLKEITLGQSDGHTSRFGLFVGVLAEILLLKLVFDLPLLRKVVFALYTTTLVLLFATTSLAFDDVFAFISFGIMTIGWWTMWLLSGVQYDHSFLTWHFLGFLPGVLAVMMMFGVIVITPSDQDASPMVLGLICEIFFRWVGALELTHLYETLPPHEVSLAVYYVSFDLLNGLFVQPMIAISFMLLIGFILTAKLCYDLVKSLVLSPITAISSCCGKQKACAGLDCHLGLVQPAPQQEATRNELPHSHQPAPAEDTSATTTSLEVRVPGAANETMDR